MVDAADELKKLEGDLAFKAYELSMANMRLREWEACAKFELQMNEAGDLRQEFKGWDWDRLDQCRHRYLTPPNVKHEGEA